MVKRLNNYYGKESIKKGLLVEIALVSTWFFIEYFNPEIILVSSLFFIVLISLGIYFKIPGKYLIPFIYLLFIGHSIMVKLIIGNKLTKWDGVFWMFNLVAFTFFSFFLFSIWIIHKKNNIKREIIIKNLLFLILEIIICVIIHCIIIFPFYADKTNI
ncbi:MAG: hypothetical protein LBV74_09725 [Tannerella sp.]|jgi:hypothetical protein|nr:hypothetical protein [Tannerella sp.]